MDGINRDALAAVCGMMNGRWPDANLLVRLAWLAAPAGATGPRPPVLASREWFGATSLARSPYALELAALVDRLTAQPGAVQPVTARPSGALDTKHGQAAIVRPAVRPTAPPKSGTPKGAPTPLKTVPAPGSPGAPKELSAGPGGAQDTRGAQDSARSNMEATDPACLAQCWPVNCEM
jgi:hypothetical protein